MPGGHNTTIEVSNIMSFVLYTQILKKSVLKPASPGITLTVLPQENVDVSNVVFMIQQFSEIILIISTLHNTWKCY